MAKKVRVILLENINGLGQSGDTVTVSEGYARNFLFPNGQAALATSETDNVIQQRQAKQASDAAQRLLQAEELAAILENAELTMAANVKEGDEIYGKITAAAVAKELSSSTSHTFKAKDILLGQPITKLGEYDIPVIVGENVEANIHLAVKPD